MLKTLGLLFGGALVGSYFEYRFSYNIYDFFKDKIVGVLHFLHLVK
jgi:hypothetical protein